MGLGLILGYLFFDGLTSTTQERMFKSTRKEATSPLTGNGNANGFSREIGSVEKHLPPLVSASDKSDKAYDQMLWVNLFSLGVSVIGKCFSLISPPWSR